VLVTRNLSTDADENVASCYLFFVARLLYLGLQWKVADPKVSSHWPAIFFPSKRDDQQRRDEISASD